MTDKEKVRIEAFEEALKAVESWRTKDHDEVLYRNSQKGRYSGFPAGIDAAEGAIANLILREKGELPWQNTAESLPARPSKKLERIYGALAESVLNMSDMEVMQEIHGVATEETVPAESRSNRTSEKDAEAMAYSVNQLPGASERPHRERYCKLQGKGPHWLCQCDVHPYSHCRFCSKPVESLPPASTNSPAIPDKEELYYIQDKRSYCGNSCFWWKPDGNGYTCNLDEAWKVTREKAESMMRHRPDVDVAWPVSVIDAGTARHFDMQKLREMKSL